MGALATRPMAMQEMAVISAVHSSTPVRSMPGTADIALVDSVCALGMVRPDSDYADLVVNMDNNFGDQFYGIAFRKGSDFTAMVNESIAKLKEDGTVAELAEKYGLTDALIQ